MNVNDSSSITQYSGPIRGSSSFFFECLFQIATPYSGSGAYPPLENTTSVDLTNILRDTSRYTDRPVLYTISVSDYQIKHDVNFSEPLRELLAINSPEITGGQTRYLTLIPNDQGVGLFGSNAIVLEKLPPKATFTLGFVNPVDSSDYVLQQPNSATVQFSPAVSMSTQLIQYAIVRFRVQAQFL